MSGLVDSKGRPLSSSQFTNKKAKPPPLGARYGQWAGEQTPIFNLPGGGALAFDTSQLTLADFRQMKGHYQINSSLSVLTFMMHQMEWHIECENKKIAELVERNLRDVWSRLVRAKSQALWAGFSPNALEWENDIDGRIIVLNKIKDLYPEDCTVNWKKITNAVPGSPGAKQTFSVYDGIRQYGSIKAIPVDNSYWYPLLMENGNYYGRRLLESAFQPWFFSTLMHLFANRYYERFGEPVPIGRAPYEEEINVEGVPVRGNVLMSSILNSLRNRSTVILPNEKTAYGDETSPDYDYQIEYLESQMRGADFERYMTRLDEEMSLALFTPILMMRTADVGSYNLGTQHAQVYLWMLNAIAGDWAHYINKFIIRPIVAFNSSRNAPRCEIKFVRMGKVKAELLQAIVTELFQKDAVKYDVREIGEMAGLTLEENEAVSAEPTPPPEEEPVPPAKEGTEETDNVIGLIKKRVGGQVNSAYRKGDFENGLQMGYKRQLTAAFMRDGYANADRRVEDFYNVAEKSMKILTELGVEEWPTASGFMDVFSTQIDNALKTVKV